MSSFILDNISKDCEGCNSPDLDVVFGHECAGDIRNAGLTTRTAVEDTTPRYGEGIGSSARSRRSGFSNAASPAQMGLINKLIAELDLTFEETVPEDLTKASASSLIDNLMSQAKKARESKPAADTRRPNKYAGKCVKCGGQVPAEAGYLTKDASGRWAAEHKGECPAVEAEAPAPAATEAPEGMHQVDGAIYKVQRSQQSGNVYAKVLDEDKGKFEYAPGAVRRLSEATKMTAEAAAEFGKLYGFCCRCARTLTDERSIEVGYGSTCAAHEGWPWG